MFCVDFMGLVTLSGIGSSSLLPLVLCAQTQLACACLRELRLPCWLSWALASASLPEGQLGPLHSTPGTWHWVCQQIIYAYQCCLQGTARRQTGWAGWRPLTSLENAVLGLTMADKPTLEGKLLQLLDDRAARFP